MALPNFGNSAAAPSKFAGLDTAEVGTPKLFSGTVLVEIVKCESEDGQFGLAFHCHVRVLEADNPMNVAGKIYRWTRGGLTKNQWQESNMGRLKGFLAAALDADPREPPSPGETWAETVDEACAPDPNNPNDSDLAGRAMAGLRVMLVGEEATGPNGPYIKWKSFPAPK